MPALSPELVKCNADILVTTSTHRRSTQSHVAHSHSRCQCDQTPNDPDESVTCAFHPRDLVADRVVDKR